jgi:hypothetical protein
MNARSQIRRQERNNCAPRAECARIPQPSRDHFSRCLANHCLPAVARTSAKSASVTHSFVMTCERVRNSLKTIAIKHICFHAHAHSSPASPLFAALTQNALGVYMPRHFVTALPITPGLSGKTRSRLESMISRDIACALRLSSARALKPCNTRASHTD